MKGYHSLQCHHLAIGYSHKAKRNTVSVGQLLTLSVYRNRDDYFNSPLSIIPGTKIRLIFFSLTKPTYMRIYLLCTINYEPFDPASPAYTLCVEHINIDNHYPITSVALPIQSFQVHYSSIPRTFCQYKSYRMRSHLTLLGPYSSVTIVPYSARQPWAYE
jgi:hypothetical protein